VKQKVLVSAIKKIVGAELLLSAAFAPVAFAQTAPAAPASGATSASAPAPDDAKTTQLQRVEVTGSLIRSSDKTGHTDVQTVTAKEIEDSGYTNVSDFLRGTSANSASSWSQSTMNSTAPGGAGIALRGLSEKYTLVLVDGQRVANYALAVNFSDTFFDVNTIPLNMVDHIDIVKTGAVSEYGSDAIAGVVNIVTKKNYHGLQIDADLGKAQHPGDAQGRFSVLGGFGDLNADRYNVTGAVSWYRDTGSRLDDRDMTKNEDFSQFPFGSGAPTGPNQSSFFGTPGTTTALNPCQPGTVAGKSDATSCNFNTAHNYSLVPSNTDWNAKVRGTFKISDDIQAYADVWVSRNETIQYSGIPAATSLSNVFNQVPGQLTPLNRTVPAGNPFNPFGVATPINYTFNNVQTAVDTVSTYWKASTGVKGTFAIPKAGDWDWAVDYGHSQSVVSNTYTNALSVPGFTSLINSGTFNFSNPGAYPAGLFQDDNQSAITTLDSVTATTSTSNLFSLPAGDVGLGFGTEFRHESTLINPDTLADQGLVAPARVQSVDGERNVAAIYYQFDIPIIHNLTFTQSGRYDHYSDFGGAFSPNFALRYQPVQMLTTYASFSRGFRAPTPVENSQSVFIGHQTLTDPFAPGGPQTLFASEYSVGNPALQPEHTKNYNIGFSLSPDATTDFGFDYYKVKIDGVIGTADPDEVLAENDPSQVVRNADGSLRYIQSQFVNLGSLTTDGFDINFRKSLGTKFGTFTLSADWAYVWHFNLETPDGTTSNLAGNNLAFNQPFGASNPRWKGNTTLAWDYAQFTTTLTWQYTGPYSNTLAQELGIATTPSVASYSQFNLFTTYRGFKNWTLYAGVNNLFDRQPPFDAVWTSYPDITGYDQSLYTDLGRFFQIGATYRFR
jgi:iron complex outermembrane receptor protein